MIQNIFFILKVKSKLGVNQLVKCGWIQLLIQNLKVRNQSSLNISKILDILIQWSDKGALSTFMCSKLFQILIKRLQLQYRDQNAKKLIMLLKKIKQKTTITSQTAIFLLQFSCFFLTQKQLILSPRYHRRVRQVICILSYFITFNIELKIIFRDPNFISIIRDWIKVDTVIEDESSIGESCRLCLFVIYNDQSMRGGLESLDVVRESHARQQLEKGLKCTLYRRDGTSKAAMIKLGKQNDQIIAYKTPNGQIKQKYRIPLDCILSLRYQYQDYDDDILFNDSVFPKDSGLIFGSRPKSEQLLMSIIGMVGQQLSIRQINVEFNNKQAKDAFVNYFKTVLTVFMNKRLKA